MNGSEFRDWLAYHTAAFPSVAKWLDGNPATVAHWQRALEDVELDAAKRATDEMVRGELDEPRGYSEHPRRIRRRAKEIAFQRRETDLPQRRVIDGEPVFSCAICQDRGTVLIVHPKTIRQIVRDVPDGDLHWLTCVVACTCSAGDRWAEQRWSSGRTKRLPRMDAARMFAVDGPLTDDLKAECIAWARERLAHATRGQEWQPTISYEEVVG